jgi:hypothetical protein
VLHSRLAVAADEQLLYEFQCATTDDPWDLEVQLYVSTRALRDALLFANTPRQHRLLLWFDDDELVAVGAHSVNMIVAGDGTHVVVVALAAGRQGSRQPSGERLSDVVLTQLLEHGLATRSGRVLVGVVHKDNARSLTMCGRNGFVMLAKLPPDEDYRYVARLT